jgi:hypothetical protein
MEYLHFTFPKHVNMDMPIQPYDTYWYTFHAPVVDVLTKNDLRTTLAILRKTRQTLTNVVLMRSEQNDSFRVLVYNRNREGLPSYLAGILYAVNLRERKKRMRTKARKKRRKAVR